MIGELPSDDQALQLEQVEDFAGLQTAAATLRDKHFRNLFQKSLYSAHTFVSRCLPLLHFCANAEKDKSRLYER